VSVSTTVTVEAGKVTIEADCVSVTVTTGLVSVTVDADCVSVTVTTGFVSVTVVAGFVSVLVSVTVQYSVTVFLGNRSGQVCVLGELFFFFSFLITHADAVLVEY